MKSRSIPQSSGGSAEGRASEIVVRVAAAVAITALALLAYRSLLGLGLLGLDTYPMILTGRITSAADLWGTFTEELMDGRYTGSFYRPVANLAIAFDHALWGLDPLGYHLTDLAILVVNALLVFALARQLFGRALLVGAFTAAVVFVLHPIQLELLPVPARRADTLCLAFILASLLAQSRHRLLAGLCALLAVGSKETGVIVVPLVFGLHLLRSGEGPAFPRLCSALKNSLTTIVAVLVFAVVRTRVLGGLGGHEESSFAGFAKLPHLFSQYVIRVTYPQPLLESVNASLTLVTVAATAVALVAALLWRNPQAADDEASRGLRTGLSFLALWFVCLLMVTASAGRLHDWYAMLFVAPYAILVGLLLDRGVAALRAGRTALGAAAVVLSTILLANHIGFSALLPTDRYDAWPRADVHLRDLIERYEHELDRASPRSRIVLDRFVPWIQSRDGSGVRSAAIIADYSLQAYSELTHPERAVQCELFMGGPIPDPPPGDVVHVLLFPGQVGGQPPGR